MIEWFNTLNNNIQVVIISSITSVLVFIIGWVFKVLYERNSLKFKLKKEYEFEQKKRLKEEIAKNKIHLLNAVEEFNHRLWNFTQNVDKNWHNISTNEWTEPDKYYIKSFVYRFLKVLYWTIKTEKDTISIDTTIADKYDILFLKYVKTLKDIFTDADLLSSLDYNNEFDTNHFFKNNLITYAKQIIENENVVDFDVFSENTNEDYDIIKPVIQYFSTIKDDNKDKNLNVLRCFHLISIQFLNKYGHDYQKTEKQKIYRITTMYKEKLSIKKEFSEFLKKSKLNGEMRKIESEINNESPTKAIRNAGCVIIQKLCK